MRLEIVLYHPEAVVLVAQPVEALDALHRAVRSVTPSDDEERRLPHVTVAYSTLDQPAAPLIDVLGHTVPERTVTISAVSLVVHRGRERTWNRQTLATVPPAA